MFKTRITELLGSKYPITQGGMHQLGYAEFTAAVAEAGAFPFMTALTHPDPKDLRNEINKTRKLTNKPFGVNLTISRHAKAFKYPELIKVIIDEGITIVETAAYRPDEYIYKLKEAGLTVVHKCTSIRFALHAQKIGCDVVSIDGFECAGMPGEDDVTSLILIPLAKDALRIPIIASGGFGDARGFVAALALGAEGVNMGTRFVATQECPVHEKVKQAFIAATERDTQIVMKTFRAGERCLKTTNTQRIVDIEIKEALAATRTDPEAKGAPLSTQGFEKIFPFLSGEVSKIAYEAGDLDKGIIGAGEILGLISDIPTVKALIDRIISEARELVFNRLPGMFGQ